jgi:hypothetical protein
MAINSVATTLMTSHTTVNHVATLKAYWCTAPGLGGCKLPSCQSVHYPAPIPLLFNLWEDPYGARFSVKILHSRGASSIGIHAFAPLEALPCVWSNGIPLGCFTLTG